MKDLLNVPTSFFRPDLFDELFNGFFYPQRREERSVSNLLIPLADIVETDYAYSVRVELPGLKKDDIKVNFSDDMLTISGESSSSEEKEEEGKIIHQERHHRSYRRTMRVPRQVDVENIHAEFKDGLLEVVLPKLEKEDQTERIDIQVS